MNLSKMSTIKPRFKSSKSPKFSSENLRKQGFNPESSNQVWATNLLIFSRLSLRYS